MIIKPENGISYKYKLESGITATVRNLGDVLELIANDGKNEKKYIIHTVTDEKKREQGKLIYMNTVE